MSQTITAPPNLVSLTETPGQRAWRRLKKRKGAMFGLAIIAVTARMWEHQPNA